MGSKIALRNERKTHSGQEKTHIVLGETGSDGDNGPGHHDGDEEGGNFDSSDQHIGGDTGQDVTDKENRDTGLILDIGKTKIVFDGAHCSSACAMYQVHTTYT